jgi:hypothetical protein
MRFALVCEYEAAYLLGRSPMRRGYLIVVVAVVAVLAGVMACFIIPRAKLRAELLGCGNYMVSVCFAGRMWANDNGGRFPSDLLSMSNEVVAPKLFICPGDRSRKPAASWASFTPQQSSFELVTAGLRNGDTNSVFLRCKIHGTVGYADGSVFVSGKRHRKGER